MVSGMKLSIKILFSALPLLFLSSVTHAENIIRAQAPIAYVAPAVVVPEPPSGYRYWRLFILANNGDPYHAIAELELRAEHGGPDLTTPSTHTLASSIYSTGYIGAQAVDNDPRYWLSDGNTNPQHLEFDLINPVTVREIAIFPNPQAGYYLLRSPRDFRVEASNDKLSWDVIKQYQGFSAWSYEAWSVFSLE